MTDSPLDMAGPVAASLDDHTIRVLVASLRAAHATFAARYRGESGARQPVHTVYGGGHLFRANTAPRLGTIARAALDEFAPDPETLASAIGIEPELSERVYERLLAKLRDEPVEDYRIDFEDGYGSRSDAEEDRDAIQTAREVVRGRHDGTLPPFIGIRIKPLTAELTMRSVRTLDLFVTTLVHESNDGTLPQNFVVTLPKVTVPEQITALADVLDTLERTVGLAPMAIPFELMVETPQLIMDASGRSLLPATLDASRGRLRGAHFGPYDYSAACGITAAYQGMRHPACESAKEMMQVAYAGTGVWLSDGPTMVMPVPVHRGARSGSLSTAQRVENVAGVHRAWRLHYEDVRYALGRGFYQGWDLHPAQLVTRHAAVVAFFLEGLPTARTRMVSFVANAAQATLVGDVFDDAATGQGLLNYFLRAMSSGAMTEAETMATTGLTVDELRERSFVKILEGRRQRGKTT